MVFANITVNSFSRVVGNYVVISVVADIEESWQTGYLVMVVRMLKKDFVNVDSPVLQIAHSASYSVAPGWAMRLITHRS